MEPISLDEVRVLDANSEHRGVPTLTLMENAGLGLAEHLLELGAKGKRVVVLCGSGNNGGDGFVAARHLHGKSKVDVVLVRSADQVRTGIARTNLQRAELEGVPIHAPPAPIGELLAKADFVVDALLGVGAEGAPRGSYAEAIRAINASGKRVVSVDVPSGWGTEMAVRPEVTVTFHAPKEGMGAECGNVVVKPIGVPPDAVRLTGPGELLLVPAVARDAHKRERGTVLVVGGGPYHGAPTLCALAAHRAGVDLAFLAVPGAVADVVRAHSLDLIVHGIGGRSAVRFEPAHSEEVQGLWSGVGAVVLGPGIGAEPATLEFARAAYVSLVTEGKPVVVDADALRAIAGAERLPRGPSVVLTPHSGEYGRIAGSPLPPEGEGRNEAVRAVAYRLGCTLLVKAPLDVISDGTRVKLNDTGNAAMATGGTGDVLAGVVGAFLAKGMRPFDAARAAAFVVGAAGDAALAKVGHSMLATDVVAEMPGVLGRHVPWWTRK